MGNIRITRRGKIVIGILTFLIIAGLIVFMLRQERKEISAQLQGLGDKIVQEQCLSYFKAGNNHLDLAQAKNAAWISATAIKQNLPAQAAVVAVATAWQESNLRNIGHGDLDSIGLFQQRPSQGWGTVAELSDPVKSTEIFYKALAKIDKWEDLSINDAAQKVQRSGVPDGYKKWEEAAQTTGDAFTGELPAAFSCLVRSHQNKDPQDLAHLISTAYGEQVSTRIDNGKLIITSPNPKLLWGAASFAIAYTDEYGLKKVKIGEQYWENSSVAVPTWKGKATGVAGQAEIEFDR